VAINVVILAAGMGTRLGRPHPKPLTPLADGRSIMRQQLDHLRRTFGAGAHVTIVVGFKMDLIMEAAAGDAAFVYNELYDQTGTAKSLLKALRLAPPGGVLWLNGDVVFDAAVLDQTTELIHADQSFVCVDTSTVAEEEVKYTLDEEGYIAELSKTVVGGLGEAVGINYVSAADKPVLVEHLEACADSDYFERAMETAIQQAGVRFRPLDISRFSAVEVDFEDDLARANTWLRSRAVLEPMAAEFD
jgi:choline kinase